MRRSELEIRDKKIIMAILDLCKVITVSMFDEEYPYAYPTNYGYVFDDNLVFYTHHAPTGHKLDLRAKNPKVCVTAYAFADHIINPRSPSKSKHDYRSVTAFGVMEEVFPGTPEYRVCWQRLLECNGRKAAESFLAQDHSPQLRNFKITCCPENITGKAQIPVRSLDEVPLPTEPAYDLKDPPVFT